MKTAKRFLPFALAVSCAAGGFAQEAGEPAAEHTSLYAALGGGLFANGVFHGAARLFGADFAQTSIDSYWTNLTSTWVWDNDAFLFNHPGHPYQGGLYHAAARAGGFSFYEALFFDTLGSVTWELFGETDIPSCNDLIITTFGGAVFGEMMHRLYLETSSLAGRVAVSPLDALTSAALRKRPRQTHNLSYLSAMSGASWIRSGKGVEREFQNGRENMPLRKDIYNIDIGFEAVYGDPFTHASRVPYSQFEIATQIGGSFWPLWLDWTIIAEGYLFAFNPVFTERDSLSTGFSLHYDMIAGSNINCSSQALDWSVKWKHNFTNTTIALKASAGWTVFGSSQYYPDIAASAAENDFGTGANAKVTFSLLTPRLGTFTLGTYNYLIYIIPHNKPDSSGVDFFNLSCFRYSYPLTKKFSINIDNALYLKHTKSRKRENTVEMTNRVMLYGKWAFIDKGSDT
jgi:hypothetical protein